MSRLSTSPYLKTLKVAALASCVSVFAVGCSDDDDDTPRVNSDASCSGNIVEIADCNSSFDTLAAAVAAANLVDTLSGTTEFTVFAPTDAAFSDLFADLGVTPEQFLARSDLADILTYHVLPGTVGSAAAITLAGEMDNTTATVEGASVTLTFDGTTLTVDRSEVVQTDVTADNGLIHAINKVLIPPDTFNIVETAQTDGRFDILASAVVAAGTDIVNTLSGTDELTVFAPTDDAFTELLTALGVTAEQFLARTDLADILTYHVLGDAVNSTAAITAAGDMATNMQETVQGADVTLSVDDGALFVDRSEVIVADVEVSNGVIHAIDKVLIPPATFNNVEMAQADGRFNTLVAAVVQADLVTTLVGSDFTIFAPTDDAFTALFDALGVTPEQFLARTDLGDILTYHVLQGSVNSTTAIGLAGDTETDMQPSVEGSEVTLSLSEGNLFVDRSQVIVTDVEVLNGFIHAIDKVLVPPDTFNIVETAQADGRFTTLVAAVVEADLVDTLSAAGARTVFAPTDDAFNTLIAENDAFSSAQDILALDNLADILLYHVLPTEVDSTAAFAASGTTVATALTDNSVGVSTDGGNLFINNAQVVVANVDTSNGLIHAIDRVLLPASPDTANEGSTITAIVDALANAADAEFTYLLAALEQEGLDAALEGAGPFTVFAPTDAAFAAVGTPSEVLALANLTDILQQHVVPASVDSVSAYAAASGGPVTTLETSVNVTLSADRGLQVNGNNIVTTDVIASNGIIHIIDGVITD